MTVSMPLRVLLSLSVFAVPAAAQETQPFLLDPIVLSASGSEQALATAPASVTVIDGADLRRGPTGDLTQMLRDAAGVSTSGTADGQNISIRGLPGEYTLILVDGKRQNTRESRTNGSGGIEQFYIPPAQMIDRIEIVRGPMSALYGSDAMGGVVNIITRPGVTEAQGGVRVEGTIPQHSADAADRQISFHAGTPLPGDWSAQLWGRRFERDGSGRANGPGTRDVNDLRARLTWAPDPTEGLTAEAGRTRITDPDTVTRVNRRDSLSLRYRRDIGDWATQTTLTWEQGSRQTDGSSRRPEIGNSTLDFKADRSFVAMGSHDVTLGGQLSRARLSDQNPGLATEEQFDFANRQAALFAEDVWQVSPDLSLTGALRWTDDQRFGGKLTPRLYAVYQLRPDLFLTGGVATGYRTPELRQTAEDYYFLTNQRRAVIVGTPDLNPEESTSIELGLRHDGPALRFSATAFYTDFRNRIDSRDTGETIALDGTRFQRYEYYNIGKARIRGLELTGHGEVGDAVTLSANYTFTDSEQKNGQNAGLPLTRTPRHKALLRADWQARDNLGLWGSIAYHGEETVAGRSGTQTWKGYVLADLGVEYRIGDRVTLDGQIRNLFDKQIDSADFNTVINGRSLFLAISASF
ncbi:TonB-dependent receptor domain-containing protein [Paracoccus sp. NSM]|uniref:TonB-dependent receptor domain-containing protein n=1 Tax=Paracoccus sp. NSM TaxID=3457784 RepID=UPI004036997F